MYPDYPFNTLPGIIVVTSLLASKIIFLRECQHFYSILFDTAMNASEPHVILVDKQDQPIGTLGKLAAHEQGLLHRAFSIFIFRETTDHRLETLLQKRHEGKYHCGGLWTNACCSHPAPGETLETATARRLKEELNCALPLHSCGHFIYKATFPNGLIEHEFDHVFIGKLSCEESLKFQANPQEISEVKWIGVEKMKAWLHTKPHEITPWFQQAFSLALRHQLCL